VSALRAAVLAVKKKRPPRERALGFEA